MNLAKDTAESAATEPSTIRTLIVDDCPIMLKVLKGALLRDDRVRVVGTAADGRSALHAAAFLSPQLVVVDLHLPDFSGAFVTRLLKQLEDPPVVFIVTSDVSVAARRLGSHAGADAFLAKDSQLPSQLKTRLNICFGAYGNPLPCLNPSS